MEEDFLLYFELKFLFLAISEKSTCEINTTKNVRSFLATAVMYGTFSELNPLMLTAAKTSLTILMKSFFLKHDWQNI